MYMEIPRNLQGHDYVEKDNSTNPPDPHKGILTLQRSSQLFNIVNSLHLAVDMIV